MRDALLEGFASGGADLWLTRAVCVYGAPTPGKSLAGGVKERDWWDRSTSFVSGLPRGEHCTPRTRTEADGRSLTLFPIEERLRYLVPFRPPEETAEHLRELRRNGARMAVLADDGEKFGGWPGTWEWVWENGWMDRYVDTMTRLLESGDVILSTPAEARVAIPSAGLAYLPSASYLEMEGWALPPGGARRLHRLEVQLGEERMRAPMPLLGGPTGGNFFVKYPESNGLPKKMMSLLGAEPLSGGSPRRHAGPFGLAQLPTTLYWHVVVRGAVPESISGNAVWANLATRRSAILGEGEPTPGPLERTRGTAT